MEGKLARESMVDKAYYAAQDVKDALATYVVGGVISIPIYLNYLLSRAIARKEPKS